MTALLDEKTTVSEGAATTADFQAPMPAYVGPYRLIRQIGAGGMGAVYLAAREHARTGRFVAVKVVTHSPEQDWVRERLRYERQVLSKLAHPHIAKLLDSGAAEDGAPYLAMEYIDGLAIDRYCRERSLTLEERLTLFLGVCEAVSYAHRNGIVHCDLKPGNILVTSRGIPKLLDFGIAKILDVGQAGVSCSGAPRMMTPQYASPEQARGEIITTASDIYSLGVVLHELIAGRRPVRRSASDSRSQRLPRTLRRIVRKAMRAEPARRYSSMEHFMADIRRYLSRSPRRRFDITFAVNSKTRALAALLAMGVLLSGLWRYVQKAGDDIQRPRAWSVGAVPATWRALTMKRFGAGPT